jgi:hypothetical protein
MVICLPNNFSVEQAETHCLDSFLSRTQPLLPRIYKGLNFLRFPHTHDRMI